MDRQPILVSQQRGCHKVCVGVDLKVGCTVWVPWSLARLSQDLTGKIDSIDIEAGLSHLLLEEIKWIEDCNCTVVAVREQHLYMGVEFSDSWMALQFFLTWSKDNENWRIS